MNVTDNDNNTALWLRYAPYLMFDQREPFYPDFVGVTVLDQPGPSPSFRRTLEFSDERVKHIVEYAIWWDYEIGHLYELEHVWVYVGQDGEVVDCEASFHGRVLKGLLKDRSNLLDGTHVRLYSQPGKHAFSPITDIFELLPDLYTNANERAGVDGLLTNELFHGLIATNDEIDGLVWRHLQSLSFVPAMEFEEYYFAPELFMPWSSLFRIIPERIEARVQELKRQYL
ncbi:hypothetical protein ACWHAM_19575 [Paenibacillus terrae]|uniref:Uncharacterized protein n=1 Tax=Paenibacillus terrae (strain HPL-003) TaxID=985665 RepID=G7W1M3_PAETH|nr:hypothetical protein [Paenibacillus terrae]AET58027.1 hypothetical protein HPL003_06320 [Paenibacillus terrae HPL-003]